MLFYNAALQPVLTVLGLIKDISTETVEDLLWGNNDSHKEPKVCFEAVMRKDKEISFSRS